MTENQTIELISTILFVILVGGSYYLGYLVSARYRIEPAFTILEMLYNAIIHVVIAFCILTGIKLVIRSLLFIFTGI